MDLKVVMLAPFYPDKVRDIVGIPPEVTIIELMALGYPADTPREHQREPMESIVNFERWMF